MCGSVSTLADKNWHHYGRRVTDRKSRIAGAVLPIIAAAGGPEAVSRFKARRADFDDQCERFKGFAARAPEYFLTPEERADAARLEDLAEKMSAIMSARFPQAFSEDDFRAVQIIKRQATWLRGRKNRNLARDSVILWLARFWCELGLGYGTSADEDLISPMVRFIETGTSLILKEAPSKSSISTVIRKKRNQKAIRLLAAHCLVKILPKNGQVFTR
jgi:hypothetical protein